MSNRRKLRAPIPTTFVSRPRGQFAVQWNYEPAVAQRVSVVVGEPPPGVFPQYWARDLVGTVRRAVRVVYGRHVFYLDDEDGSGWFKVTHGGGPDLPHRDLVVSQVGVGPTAAEDRARS